MAILTKAFKANQTYSDNTHSISKEIFAKRKSGDIDEAYDIAFSAKNDPDYSFTDWDLRAFAWCLIDLIKREVKNNNRDKINLYFQQLIDLNFDFDDEVLEKQRDYTLKLCSPNHNQIIKARNLGKEGKHTEATHIYRQLLHNGENSEEIVTGLSWELYHIAKMAIDQKIPNFNLAKKNIHEYLKIMQVSNSNLHSCFLRLATKIAQENNLQLGNFVKLWDLKNLREEDFEQVKYEGKLYPSLAEKVIQTASKDVSNRKDHNGIHYIFPFLEKIIEKYPENIWLKYYKAKMLIEIDKFEDAVLYGIELVKNKNNEYWSWKFLGEIYINTDKNLALSCYCKSLLCSDDINFTWKTKFEMHNLLKELKDFSRAKCEIEDILKFKYEKQQSIPVELQDIDKQDWFLNTNSSTNNKEFYLNNSLNAEEILYKNIPWTDAILGEKVIIKNKPKRKIYIQTSQIATEISVSENLIRTNNKKIHVGQPIKIKVEKQENERYKIYKVSCRDGQNWDIMSNFIGVINHINHHKNIINCIIDKEINCIIDFKELSGNFKLGDAISLKIVKYYSKQGAGYRAIQPVKTKEIPSKNIFKSFSGKVEKKNEIGFTNDAVFISADFMTKFNINDTDMLSGKAVLSYNKKRCEWGWKAVEIFKKDTLNPYNKEYNNVYI